MGIMILPLGLTGFFSSRPGSRTVTIFCRDAGFHLQVRSIITLHFVNLTLEARNFGLGVVVWTVNSGLVLKLCEGLILSVGDHFVIGFGTVKTIGKTNEDTGNFCKIIALGGGKLLLLAL